MNAYLLLASLVFIPVEQQEVPATPTNAVQLTKEQMAECRAGGGCVVASRRELQQFGAKQYQDGMKAQKETCRSLISNPFM